MTDHCMRTPAAARYLGIAESTLNKTRLTGEGPSFVKVGPRAVAYRRADLDAWLQARVRRSTSDTTATPTAARPLRPRGGGIDG